MPKPDTLPTILAALYGVDRAVKLAAVAHFFGKQRPADPVMWPGVTLLQPITKGASDLAGALERRVALDYPAPVQHILVCDDGDGESLDVCRRWIARHPRLDATIVRVESAGGIAAKTVKLQEGLQRADQEVVCCVDDDIALRPDALRTMIPYLCESGVGAVCGIACYIDWSNVPSSLMSAFVNANALLTYVPGTYVTEPFTITGHIFALRRDLLRQVGGFEGMESNIADDHLLAAKVHRARLRIVQTPMIYDVENHLDSYGRYMGQMKRWFVFPRQALAPLMSNKEQAATAALSAGNLIPSLLAMLALFRRRGAWKAFLFSMVAFNLTYLLCEMLYLKRATPLKRRALLSLVAVVSPLQIVGALLSNNDIEWRGRKLRIDKGGAFVELKRGEEKHEGN